MKISGYKLMDRLEELKEQAKNVDSQFSSSLYKFEDDTKTLDPKKIMENYALLQTKIAKLQEAQSIYNVKVKVKIDEEVMTLQRAIKEYGAVGHVKNQWKIATDDTNTRSSYFGRELIRNKEQEYAVRVVSVEDALALADVASKKTSTLKQLIRSGNASEVNIELEENLFQD